MKKLFISFFAFLFFFILGCSETPVNFEGITSGSLDKGAPKPVTPPPGSVLPLNLGVKNIAASGFFAGDLNGRAIRIYNEAYTKTWENFITDNAGPIAIGDLDNDGQKELAIWSSFSSREGSYRRLYIYENGSMGTSCLCAI